VPAFTSKYTPEQRDAIVHAAVDRDIPAPSVVKMAARGELTTSSGDELGPFDVPASTVRSERRRARDRRLGKSTSHLSNIEPRDALEALRRRLINMLDGELEVEERKRAGKRDPERIRQLCRAAREAAAIPGPKQPAPKRPGDRDDAGKADGGQTRGGLGGDILKAHRSQTATSGKGKPHTDTATQEQLRDTGAQQGAAHNEDEAQERADDEAPGSSQRAVVARLVPAP
jgi:hypothetical protein